MPIKGFENVPGEMFKALEEAGHGRRLVIADRSLDIATTEQVVMYRGRTSAEALADTLKLVQREGVITLMLPDMSEMSSLDNYARAMQAHDAFDAVLEAYEPGLSRGYEVESIPRLTKEREVGDGFYDLISNPSERRLFVRTPDDLPYACASFVIGHSQFGTNTDTGALNT